MLESLHWIFEVFNKWNHLLRWLLVLILKTYLVWKDLSIAFLSLKVGSIVGTSNWLHHHLVWMRRLGQMRSIHWSTILLEILQREYVWFVWSYVSVVSRNVAWKWMIVKRRLRSENILRGFESMLISIKHAHTWIDSQTLLPCSLSCAHSFPLSIHLSFLP